jgi:hypothetical protein
MVLDIRVWDGVGWDKDNKANNNNICNSNGDK